MQTVIDFLVHNYLWFLIISLILIFALIGYLVDTAANKDKSPKNSVPLDNGQLNMQQENEPTTTNMNIMQ